MGTASKSPQDCPQMQGQPSRLPIAQHPASGSCYSQAYQSLRLRLC